MSVHSADTHTLKSATQWVGAQHEKGITKTLKNIQNNYVYTHTCICIKIWTLGSQNFKNTCICTYKFVYVTLHWGIVSASLELDDYVSKCVNIAIRKVNTQNINKNADEEVHKCTKITHTYTNLKLSEFIWQVFWCSAYGGLSERICWELMSRT